MAPPPATLQSSSIPGGNNNSSSSHNRYPSFNAPSPARIRSYLLRLPLFTRITVFFIFALWLLELQSVWNVVKWGSLIPNEVSFGSAYRLNTYPVVHMGFFHMILDLVCLVPLLERFEAEFGTIVTLAMFVGPLSTIPGVIYVLIERGLLGFNTPILGASVWVFMLLGKEAITTYRSNPNFDIAGVLIPTWISPIILIIVSSVLLPNTSFLGHMCAVGVGYFYGLGYLKFLAPPEKILRWIEAKLNLLGRLPHYVSVDQKTYGRYGVLPQTNGPRPETAAPIQMNWLGSGSGSGQRLGP